MTTAFNVLILVSLVCVVVQILHRGSRIKADAVGKPPIAWPALVIAKLCATVSLLLLFVRAVEGGVQLPVPVAVVFLCLLVGGTVILTLAFGNLGSNLRMGLPKEDTVLVTSGIYRVSRNPMYLALFTLLGASVIYAFSWLNLAVAAIAIVLHHRIVLAEERDLTRRFADYGTYRKKVRRYL